MKQPGLGWLPNSVLNSPTLKPINEILISKSCYDTIGIPTGPAGSAAALGTIFLPGAYRLVVQPALKTGSQAAAVPHFNVNPPFPSSL